MYIPRIYQNGDLTPGDIFTLDAQASHHIIKVLRLKNGSKLTIFNGKNGEFSAILRSNNTVSIEEQDNPVTESPLQIHLGQALCRNDKMDYVIQKAVELGVSSITPVITRYSENKISEKRLERWERIIISACEQSGRTYLPKIETAIQLSKWLGNENTDFKLILTPRNGELINKFEPKPLSISILIGPESGFDDKEVELALSAGFNPLTLGPRVLRTETAALAIISVLQSKYGDF